MTSDRARGGPLRQQLQTLDNLRREALVSAVELRERLAELGTIIRVQDLHEFSQLMTVADRLVAQLSQERGGR